MPIEEDILAGAVLYGRVSLFKVKDTCTLSSIVSDHSDLSVCPSPYLHHGNKRNVKGMRCIKNL